MKKVEKKIDSERKLKTQTIIILILISIIIICAVVIVIILNNKTLNPDYAPGEIDPNAILLPTDGTKLNASEGGGAVALSYSDQVVIDLKTKEVSIYFKNPSRSTQDMGLQIFVTSGNDEILIAKSNRIPIGHALYKLTFMETAKLQKGGYKGNFSVTYYDEESDERALVNTKIPIVITVK